MYPETIMHLPICEVLEQIKDSLGTCDALILQAAPGAGKTTVVPLALLDEKWLGMRKILVLEPRRIAARAAAQRMSQLLGEPVGETVGYRMRMDSCVGRNTRIEVVTEGVLTRQLQQDPGLEDIGLVIFDEHHERNLDSDLCLALALHGREVFRDGPALKLLLMSATLEGDAISSFLEGAPVLKSGGRQFSVATRYGASQQLRDSIVPSMVGGLVTALEEQKGSILAFLPGKKEIRLVAQRLAERLSHTNKEQIVIAPLYGGLSMEQQQRAILPAPDGRRKVVLATNIAETSLTIEDISVVVDSGLVREAIFDPSTGMSRLTTRRVSAASAEQRRGRAGRLGPGVCYRLWSEQQHQRLVAHTSPEILQADLTPMVLQLLSWGVEDCAELRWLDPPPAAAYAQGIAILRQCGAVFRNTSGNMQLTPHGVRLAQIPVHPRLAHMLSVGCDIQASETACLLAAVLSERNPLAATGGDISQTLAVLMNESPCPPDLQGWFKHTWQQSRRFARMVSGLRNTESAVIAIDHDDILGVLIASAYPDRIACLDSGDEASHYRLSNGRRAALVSQGGLLDSKWLAVAELGGQVGEPIDIIHCASRLNPGVFQEILSPLVKEVQHVAWDYRKERFIAERRNLVGCLEISSEALQEIPKEARARALLGVVRKKGLQMLPWSHTLQQWRARVMLLRRVAASPEKNPWPDLSDQALLRSLENWLLPFLDNVRCIDDFQKLDMHTIMATHLPWPLPLELERLAPVRWVAPSGSNIVIDYLQSPPVLAVKLQEMFGCAQAPAIAEARVVLMVHLLSPSQRPLQVTQDLASFWETGYQQVKREMKGRYPKHPWPDDPLQAAATRHTKKRMRNR